MSSLLRVLRGWPRRRHLVALSGAVLTALLIGVPTAVVPSPLFDRMTPVEWWNIPVLAATSLLAGVLLASYVRIPSGSDRHAKAGSTEADEAVPGEAGGADDARRSVRLGGAGGLLAFFAVGCPVCNKLIVLALGTSGALTLWAPVQPVVALASLALIGWATVRRLRAEAACPV
ncbi:hypothetical protein PJ985_13975 [Streptomyces sp. ACA25]|uniref:hypothetical protein n=1 Tax=Streptomyces sp. ACA25 TaxID=3022596 RepID=UPI0023075A62|nr:hypothetical protein [Streptomyces sp. ACA25]MDB1088676.1 hypothetical protein [Streptomyces sp. ACA25]